MKKCKNRKKTIGGRVMTAVTVMMIALTGMGLTDMAMADNTDQTEWRFQFTAGENNSRYLTRREKYTDSYIYLKWSNQYAGNVASFYAAPYGAKELSGDLETVGYKKGSAEESLERKCVVPRIGEYRITNYVHENGYAYAALKMWGKTGSGYAYGTWSPDSFGSGTVLK